MPRSPVAFALLCLTLCTCLHAQQRRALTHDDYDGWKSLRGTSYSHDGKWVAFQIEPAWGDGELLVRQTTGDTEHRFPLAGGARFSADGRFVAFTVTKSKVSARDKQIEDLRKQAENQREGRSGRGTASAGGSAGRRGGTFAGRRGGASTASRRSTRTSGRGRRGPGGGGGNGNTVNGGGDLRILDLETGKVEEIGQVRQWALPVDAALLLFQKGERQSGEDNGTGEGPGTRGGRGQGFRGGRGGRRGGGGSAESRRPEGSALTIRDLASGSERVLDDVVSFGFTRRLKWMWYHTSAKDTEKGDKHGLFLQSSDGKRTRTLLDGIANVGNVTASRDEACVAFTSDLAEFGSSKRTNDLYLWEGGDEPARRIAYVGADGMPAAARVSGRPTFSHDGTALSFSVEQPPTPAPLPILPDDQVTLDIWNWRDGLLQTMQAKGRGRGGSDSMTAVWHRKAGKLVVLGDERTPSLRFLGTDGRWMLGSDSTPYEKEVQWDGRYSDHWLVNARTGQRDRVIARLRGSMSSSPSGRYLIWFDPDYHWICMDTQTGKRHDLTGKLSVPFHRHDDDHPSPDSPYGIAGWTEDDRAVLLYDEFDVWKVSPENGHAVCITDGYGRDQHLELRLQLLPRKEESLWVQEELLLSARNVDTMATGFFADSLHRTQKPTRLCMMDKSISGLTRPRNSSRLFFRQSTFREYGDLWTARADFSETKRLSDANPQQKEFRWGDAELVHWVDGNGDPRRGVLIKPDDFDPQKKYPMMVHFYEKMSQRLHSYTTPAAGTSPNASYYVSNGYLWFMPDVVYEIGYPGPSCVKCVVSGVQHLIEQGFVDRNAIAASGHSWGGYQTAFLVTRTNIFKAVESGAPVSNMLSAYGGIRYDSGMSRQFQYEQTQSRIGGTPWQYPMRYTENSPIHFADKVQTPVLILHNDQDGAVPWTQGIEYFVALRRLGKEAYLFNYNGEAHGLRKRQNQRDWTRRMQEYFDHHLKGEPAPKWMTEGVPYKDRDTEKLPYAPSYIDAHVKAPKPQPVEAEPAAKPSSKQQSKPSPSTVQASGLKVGDAAPGFVVEDEAGVEHHLDDYRGRKLLIWFYPKANTPGCTKQGCGLRDAFAELERQDVAVLGVSFDDARSNTAFRSEHDLPFPLLCDTDRAMAVAYGAADDRDASTARRIAVLIDEKGQVLHSWTKVDPGTFAQDALAALPR